MSIDLTLQNQIMETILSYFRDNFIVHVKSKDVYEDLAEDTKTSLDTSDCEVKRPLSIDKNKKVIGLTGDGLGGKITM